MGNADALFDGSNAHLLADAVRESHSGRMDCECSAWCRVDLTEEEFKAKHHPRCPHYNDKVRVVKVTYDGQSYVSTDIAGTLAGLVDEASDGVYSVEFIEMLEREYTAIPEFQGF